MTFNKRFGKFVIMSSSQNDKFNISRNLLVLIVCTAFALINFLQDYFFAINFDRQFEAWEKLFYYFLYFYTWGLLYFIIVFVAGKFKLEKKTWVKHLPIHIVAGAFIAFLHRLLTTIPYLLIFYPDKWREVSLSAIYTKTIGSSFDAFVSYWIILGAYYGAEYYKQFKESKLKEAELEKQLAQANLQALKMQLHPHFLFNTLHTVSSLMQEDINAARKVLAKLSDLLRQTLDNMGRQFIRLSSELDFLKSYLEIEKIRFQERLRIVYDIQTETLSAAVPNLILQPLVENAIKHGIASKAEGGEVKISSSKLNTLLVLKVSDNIGNGNDSNFKEGVGLTNTRKRLVQIYKTAFSLVIQCHPRQGFSVTLTLPFKEYDPEENDDTT